MRLLLAALLTLTATPVLADTFQCVGKAEAASGAQAHAMLLVDEDGERLDGFIAWNPPVKLSDGLPFKADLIYGLGNLASGTFFDMGQIQIHVTVPMAPPPALDMRAGVTTPTAGTRISRPWPAYEEAVASGRRTDMDGVIVFSMGDGSDGIFYAVNDGDDELTVDLTGGGAVLGRRFYDLSARDERDRLAAEAFAAAGEMSAAPAERCEPTA